MTLKLFVFLVLFVSGVTYLLLFLNPLTGDRVQVGVESLFSLTGLV